MKTENPGRKIRLALLASCNVDLLQKPLIAQLIERGFCPDVWNPGFNQYRQAILDPLSGLCGKSSECIILFLDAADLFADYLLRPYDHRIENIPSIVNLAAAEVFSLVRTIAERLPSATVFLNTLQTDLSATYYGMEYNSDFTFRQVVTSYNARLRELTCAFANAVVVDVEMLAACMGLERWYDSRLWYLGRIRYSALAHASLASEYARFIAARWGNVRKAIVLDLDNTLWGGIIGEEGVSGIQLGNEGIGLAFVEFQRELLNLQRKGILLAICSKNNSEDAYEAIRKHPAMVLREEHFAAFQIDWNDKAENIREIARRLNIGVDSLVFIDDNPAERQRVREAVPEIAVPEWPDDPSDYKRALSRIASEYFLKFDLTEEDRRRGKMYGDQAKRELLAESAASLEDFYKSLGMKVKIAKVCSQHVPRVSQLTQKTNQFNLTTRRYTEAEIAALSENPGSSVYWLDMEDRFGPNGIVGVLILRMLGAEEWHIDTFLMSCRVIGRTVEEAFLGQVLSEFRERGATRVTGEYIRTAKNGLVAQLYGKLGFTLAHSDAGRTTWQLDLRQKTVEIPEWFDITHLERTAVQ